MRVGAAWDEWTRASAAAARAKVAPIDEPVGPDEAVGRAAPEDDGTADQQRLGVVEHL